MKQPTLLLVLAIALTAFVVGCSQMESPTGIAPTKADVLATSGNAAAAVNVKITFIFADGIGHAEPDEYVEFKNFGTSTVTLTGWTLRDKASHIFHFPAGAKMTKNKVCRVYTNQVHTSTCGFDYHSKSAIWNNDGDTATLKDGAAKVVSKYTY